MLTADSMPDKRIGKDASLLHVPRVYGMVTSPKRFRRTVRPIEQRFMSFLYNGIFMASSEQQLFAPIGAERFRFARTFGLVACLGALLLAAAPALAQQPKSPLRLGGVNPGGVAVAATESWCAYDFTVTNYSDVDRLARVMMFHSEEPDVQYGRDVWVPAHSTIASWLMAGPAATKKTRPEVEMLLYDRTDGTERLVLPPGEERIRSRGVIFRKREPFTALMLDHPPPDEIVWGQLPQPPTPDEDADTLVRTFRHARNLSEQVNSATLGLLPPTPLAFDGIDHFVLATNRIAQDPVGLRTLRQWVEQGGRLWVMLDRVNPEVIAALLGDTFDFEIVDRVSLTHFSIDTRSTGTASPPPLVEQHERPVTFVRVLLPAQEQVDHTVNGWPAWFSRTVGRGKVVFTALGPRAWYRPRTRNDPASPFDNFSNLPIFEAPFVLVAESVHPPKDEHPFQLETLQPLLTEEIGYRVLSRGVMAMILGGFVLAAAVMGLVLRKSRRPELLGWLGPAAALGAAAVFFVLGERARRAAAPTAAAAQLVDAVAGTEEAAVHGLMAAYRQDSGPAQLGSEQGGFFDLDMTGLQGQTRRFILADQPSWRWENLELPAGIRLAPFQASIVTRQPLTAVARFGPAGLEGKLEAAPFQEVGDALVATPSGRYLAVRLSPDGAFHAGASDILPTGQFLASAVLTDRQQRRQELYREYLKRSVSGRSEGRNLFFAWAAPADLGFTLGPETRLAGSALLVLPLQFERVAPGTRVTVPAPFISFRKVAEGLLIRPTMEMGQPADMHLRFQLPEAVLPLQVERARLTAKITAPSRRITISGRADGKLVELHRVESPLDVIHVDITEERLLRLRADGGLDLNVAISDILVKSKEPDSRDLQTRQKWTIEYLELEVSGRTAP